MHTRNRLLGGLLVVLFALPCGAARDSLLIGTRPDGTEFWVEEHHFGKRIERFELVPGKPQICLNFIEPAGTPKQELALYDVLEHRLRWITDFDFASDNYVMTSRGVVVQIDGRAMMLDDDGNTQWEAKFCPLYADEASGILLGAKKESSKDIMGINISDGQRRWKGSLKHWNGLNEVLRTGDGRLLVASDQMGSIDPVTGDMTLLDIKSAYLPKEARNRANLAAVASMSVVFGALGGGLYAGALAGAQGGNFWTGAHPVKAMVHGLSSNILSQDDSIYFADRTTIWCMDSRLQPKWQKSLPNKSSMSALWIQADTLFYANYGVGLNAEGQEVEDTKAYTAAYDKRSGEKVQNDATGDVISSLRTLYFVRNEQENTFTPLTLYYNELTGGQPNFQNLYVVERQLGSDRYCIHRDSDYWLVDGAGTVSLHFRLPIQQTAWIGNVFVGLFAGNAIFQFDLSDI